MSLLNIPFDACSEYIYRLKKHQLLDLLNYLNIDVPDSLSRGELIYTFQNSFANGLTLDQLAIIDLFYKTSNSSSTTWYVYKLSKKAELKGETIQEEVIRNNLYNELKSLMNCHVYCHYYQNMLWIRVLIADLVNGEYQYIPMTTNQSCVLYLTHNVGSEFILASEIPAAYHDLILLNVCASLRNCVFSSMNLYGNDIESLLKLEENVEASGFTDYTDQQEDLNPLSLQRKERYLPSLLQQLPQTIHFLEENHIREQYQQSIDDWGKKDPPKLQSISIKSKMGGLQGGSSATDIEMNVTFQGSSVLGGLKQLVEYGYIDVLPREISFELYARCTL